MSDAKELYDALNALVQWISKTECAEYYPTEELDKAREVLKAKEWLA